MSRLKQFEPLVIHEFEESEFHLPIHSHTYYELIYIFKGNGIHHINNRDIHYKSGDLFMIAPGDEHHFTIRKSTRFAFIKFTDHYFNNAKYHSADEYFLIRPELLMTNNLLKEVKLVFDQPCNTILRKTVENIIDYNCRKDISTSPLMFYQILSLFGLIREAMAKLAIRIDNGQPDNDELISYIHKHIYEPQKISVSEVAERFNISKTYFGDYFKRNFEINYRDYISGYKMKLIENRVLSGKLTLKQIADEFGFNNESHLSHFFKKKNQKSPSEFRRAQARKISG